MNTSCIVLDTNVCLDLFVFHDSRCNALAQMLERGTVKAVTQDDCRDEWLRVLMYPVLSLDEPVRRRCMTEYDNVIYCRDFEKKNYAILPLCQDQDDQKFLEVAYDANAKFLVTKDKALLKLAAKARKSSLFQIIKPEQSYLISTAIKTD
ncbi:putative toxin-antitoxin system toxin component, PIN family [Oxalobacter vibrioformis]|uniref:Toxin-antitoxin system toxin component, PIN family n=1 Tax=Oxalobacter vibrioformis TaxID=933080 RepID=A0A9E9LWS0_9BURK|nr:putative toxin-antitoxin system toxin component, PIN family [Oxalobacter vibrioformis]WAW10686.1 putative toxin-antitoxin system toxin component, PIN family [Oxalobacter vibrioformis]